MHQPWVYFCCQFDASVMNSLTLSITYVGCHSLFIDDFKVYSDCFRWRFMDHLSHSVFDNSICQPWVYFCYRFDVSIVKSFTLSITCVGCYSPFIDDWLRGLQWLCFRCRFMDQQGHNVLDNSMRQPWLYFCYRFDASVLNSLTLSLSIRWRFHGLQWLCFRWRFVDPSWHSVFDIYMRQPWLYFCYRFHMSVVTHHSLMISRSIVTLFSLTIYGSAVK